MSAVGQRRSRWIVIALSAVVVGMAGASFGAIPLYRAFCQATGYGGTARQAAAPGERAELPVPFFLDPAPAPDPDPGDVRTVTLSDTFFRKPAERSEDGGVQVSRNPRRGGAQGE